MTCTCINLKNNGVKNGATIGLICSLTDLNRVKMKVVVMFLVMSLRMNKLKLMMLVSLVFWKAI